MNKALTVIERPSPALVHLPHPLLTAGRQLIYAAFRPGESIAAYLERHGIRFGARPVVLFLDDISVPRAAWASTLPRPGQLIVVRAALAGGGDGGDENKTLRTILSIVVLLVSFDPEIAGAVGGWFGAGANVGRAVIFIAGNLLVNALAPLPNPLKPGEQAADSPTYSLAGASNRLRPYEVMPLVFGRHRIFPDLGAKFYTEFQGEDQFLYGLFNFGLSDVVLSELKIGNTPLSEFQGVETEESGPDGKIASFPANVDSLAGAALPHAGPFVTRTSSINATAIAVDIEALLFLTDKDGPNRADTYLELEYSSAGAGTWAPLMDVPVLYAPRWQALKDYAPDSRVVATVFNGHIYRQVTVAYDVEREQFLPVGSSSGATEPIWPTGAGATIVDNGDVPTTWQEDGTISASLQYFENSTRTPIRRTFRRSVPSGQYDVRVRKITDFSGNSKWTSEFVWSVLRTYQPDSADYTGQKRLGLIIRASGQLQGVIDQLNAVAEARVAVWLNNGPALVFDGAGDYAWVTVGTTHPALDIRTNMIIEVVIKSDVAGVSDFECLVRGGIGTDQVYMLAYDSVNQRLKWEWYNGTFNRVQGTAGSVPRNAERRVRAVRTGTTLQFWIDGVLSSSHTITASTPTAAPATLTIGGTTTSQSYKGIIRDVRVWIGLDDSALPELDLPMFDGTGATLTDYSGHGCHATIVDAVWGTLAGFAWFRYQKTSNPAWLFLALARGKKLGGRRAFGGLLLDARLDLATIKDFGAWCTAKSLTFNAVVDRNMSAGELLQLIAHCGRGAPTWASGKLGVVWDAENQPAVAVFGMGNIKRSSFQVQYITGKIADEIVVRFVNPANDWIEETVRRTVPGVTAPERPVEYPLFGCTDEVMAGHAANLLAAQQVHRLRRISWECDLEAAPVQRGNVVTLSHDLTQWGYSGRIVAGRLVTNLFVWPDAFDNAVWNKRSGLTFTAPNLFEHVSGDGYIWEFGTLASATQYTISVYAQRIAGAPIVQFNAFWVAASATGSEHTITDDLVRYDFTFTTTTASAGDFGFYIHGGKALLSRPLINPGALPETYVRNTTAIVPKLVAQLDRKVPFFEDPLNPGQAEPQFVGIVFPNQFYQVFDVAPQLPGEYEQIVLDEAWPAVDEGANPLYTPDTDPGHPPYDYKYLFDPKATPGKLVKILAMQPLNEHYVRLVATDETLDYYASENDLYSYTPPSDFTAQIPTMTKLDIADTLVLSGGVYSTQIALAWDVTGRYGSASISVAPQGQPLASIGRSFERSFTFPGPAAGVLDVEVVARAPDGRTKAASRIRKTYVIIGKSRRPEDVAWISASQNGPVVVLEWQQVVDVDVNVYLLRYGLPGITWENAPTLPAETSGRGVTTAAVPPGTWDVLIKAEDDSGLRSLNAARTIITVVNELDIVFQKEQAPDWLGVLDGFVKHWTGVLVPESTNGANAHSNAELFEQFVPFPVALCTYTTPEIDIGFDDNVRVWGQITSALGRGQSDGGDKPGLEIDFKLAAGSYDGFEPWSIGDREFRYLKERAVYAPQVGSVRVLTGFIATTDLLEDTIVMKDQVIAAGGSTVTYPRQFHVVPSVEVIPKGSATRIGKHQGDTTTQTTVHLMDLSDTSAGGTADVHLTGV